MPSETSSISPTESDMTCNCMNNMKHMFNKHKNKYNVDKNIPNHYNNNINTPSIDNVCKYPKMFLSHILYIQKLKYQNYYNICHYVHVINTLNIL